jgi:uncharacterized protein
MSPIQANLSTASQPASPVSERERILSLDLLRGFAVLGILVMNIQAFAEIFAAYENPTAYPHSLEGADYWVWLVSHLLADEKMMAIFCMLYGAGLVLLTSRIEARGRRPWPIFLRRSFWLLIFGLMHAYLIWSGDILVSYAICGVLVYPFRNLAPKNLLAIGLAVVAVGSVLAFAGGWSMQFWSAKQVADFMADVWQPNAQQTAAQIAGYRGGWLAQMPLRAQESFITQTSGLVFATLWRAGGLMLVGMALYKLGLLTGSLGVRVYRNLGLAGALFGLPLIAYGVHRNFEEHWNARYSFFTGSQFNYWGSLAVSLAWICLLMIASKTPALRGVVKVLATAGRMAFSNYILESVLCTLLFYGSGFGLFSKVSRVQEAVVVVAVWIVVLIFSRLWMRRFYFGPLEWVWRSLTYGEREPFRRVHSPGALPPQKCEPRQQNQRNHAEPSVVARPPFER